MTIAIFTSWPLICMGQNNYVLPFTHYSYLEYVSNMYERVMLIGVERTLCEDKVYNNNISSLPNVSIFMLPSINGYASSYLHCVKYYRLLKRISKEVDLFYCRVPDPFSWMPNLFFHKKTIMHYVGDTIDATKHNEKWPWWKKKLMIAGYLPDYCLTLLASKRSRVYTNGYHLVNKLRRYGITATAVVSSTIAKDSLRLPTHIPQSGRVRLVYVGYIRYAKGMNCLMHLCDILIERNISFTFEIVGSGEMYQELLDYVKEKNLTQIIHLWGNIDDRNLLNSILRDSDLFFFPSLSEGSPRVVIEAMSEGVPVLSTPVGSLPYSFNGGENIRFFDYNDAEQAVSIVEEFLSDPTPFVKQRDCAYQLVKERYTKEHFLTTIFSYEI